VQSGLLKNTDLVENPDHFFAAHRTLAAFMTKLSPGFWIRLTVHFNLFCGTVIALGGPDQVAMLDDYQKKGYLGCFGLTEKFAGVNSGMIVQTTANWDEEKQMFCLHSPDLGSHKNWISQGLVADVGVVLATLTIGQKSYGPHGFLIRMRKDDGSLEQGITVGDMGKKSRGIGDDLDNAWISFDNAMVPYDALLNKHCSIENNKYVLRTKGVRGIDFIGQRLYTGRTVIAESALVFTQTLFNKTKAYTDTKTVWTPKGQRPLSSISQLRSLYSVADAKMKTLFAFVQEVETALGRVMSDIDARVPEPLAQAIAAAKVKCIETCIDLCHKLKQEVGSYALMADTGFERLDYLNCCKFAEGDSRILMQKIARDRVSAFKRQPDVGSTEELALCKTLQDATAAKGYDGWDENWEKVYLLAQTVIDLSVEKWTPISKL